MQILFMKAFKSIWNTASIQQFVGWNEICILSNRNVKNMMYVGFMAQETKKLFITLMSIVPQQYFFCYLAAISSIPSFCFAYGSI